MKQKFRRLMAGFLAVLTMFTTLFTSGTTAMAASPSANIAFWHASARNVGVVDELKPGHSHEKILYAMIDGNAAYCMNYGLAADGGQLMNSFENPSTSLSDAQNKLLAYCLYFGYGCNSATAPSNDQCDQFIATQAMVWVIVGNLFGTDSGDSAAKKLCDSAPNPSSSYSYYTTLKSNISASYYATRPSFASSTKSGATTYELKWNEANQRFETKDDVSGKKGGRRAGMDRKLARKIKSTDTKGDLYRNYAGIAKKYYGYQTAVIDLRNPTRSDGDNMLHLVNKYMDEYLADHNNLSAKAKAEKYAKITAKTIISSGGADSASYGQNAFFYDAAEGVLTAVILLIAEFCPKPFKCDVAGNDKRYGFNVVNNASTELVVFEGAIDLMSYVDIFSDFESNKIALGMLADAPLITFLDEHPQITSIKFCLDGDGPGRKAAMQLMEKYYGMGYEVEDCPPPEGYKDYNEWLVKAKQNLEVGQKVEHLYESGSKKWSTFSKMAPKSGAPNSAR